MVFFIVLLGSCTSPGIVTKQKAICVYSDEHRAEFEYVHIEHLNKVITTYQSKPGDYQVGRKYIVITSR